MGALPGCLVIIHLDEGGNIEHSTLNIEAEDPSPLPSPLSTGARGKAVEVGFAVRTTVRTAKATGVG